MILMQDKNSHQNFSPKTLIAIVSTVLTLGGAMAWFAYTSLSPQNTRNNDNPQQVIINNPDTNPNTIPETNSNQNPETNTSTNTNTNTGNNTSTSPQEKEQIVVYWLNDNLEVTGQEIEVNKTQNSEELLNIGFNQLLAGDKNESEDTAIPENTKLHSLTIQEDGIHIDLSSEFLEGGGSASMIGRLGQVIYTATSLNNNASVWINVDGQPLEVLGGEGLIVEQPMTRELFNESF